MASTRPLDPIEIRVLGALLEKEQTTPDHYPLTINALIAACNQKTNRDPVTALTETEVVEALDRLRLEALTWRSDGARVERWEQRLDRRWRLDGARKAIITILMLRGAQTAGELKTRSQRMHAFADTDSVERVLAGMRGDGADSLEALVRELPRRPGQRETRWTFVVGTDAANAAAAGPEPTGPTGPTGPSRSSTGDEARVDDSRSGPARHVEAQSSSPPAAAGPSAIERLEALESQVESVASDLEALRDDLSRLVSRFEGLRERLGDS